MKKRGVNLYSSAYKNVQKPTKTGTGGTGQRNRTGGAGTGPQGLLFV